MKRLVATLLAAAVLIVGDVVRSADHVPAALPLPPRSTTAPAGSQFLKDIASLPTRQREEAAQREILAGNVPARSRRLVPLRVATTGPSGKEHEATYFVTGDVLAVGSDEDFFRMPLTPMTAQQIATALDCSLITRKVSDDIWRNADVKIEPWPLTEKREAAETFYQHHQLIEDQRRQVAGGAEGKLIAGIKKDVVLTPRLADRPGKVAIYGWHHLDGKPIQPLYLGHIGWYVDYSHGIRLLANRLVVDGRETTVPEVLGDAELSGVLSDEGPTAVTEYSTVWPATRPASGASTRGGG